MHKTDQIIDQIVNVYGSHTMSDRKAMTFRKTLIHLVEIARAEDQMPLRVIAEAHQAIKKAKT